MIRYRDLSVGWLERRKCLSRINKILKTGNIIDGEPIKQLEEKIAKYCNRKYAIAVNSGTSAIFLVLQALGIKKDDEVIVPCLGVVPVANPILLLGAKPVFVDVREDYNINPDLIKEKITKSTRAVLAVDYTGRVCDFDSLRAITRFYNLSLVEDASQAFGATYLGKKSGSFGEISVFSMNAMKVLGTVGEAGMILTDDFKIAEQLKQMRYNGLIDKIISNHISLNHRMNTVQAVMLLQRFKNIERTMQIRRKNANLYTHELFNVLQTPKEDCLNEQLSYFTYNVRTEKRYELMEFLLDRGIETQARDSVLLPHQLPNRRKYAKLKFPVGDDIARTSLSLPMHNRLSKSDVFYICDTIREFYG